MNVDDTAGTCTVAAKLEDSSLTISKLEEARELIKALTPKEAPHEMINMIGRSGLNIIKNDGLQNDTIMVSKRLFDLLYNSSIE